MASHVSDSERRPSSATELPDKRSCIASADAVLDHPSDFEASFPSESSCEADQNHRLVLKNTAEPYKYLPLERDHIRILALLPGHVGEPLSGRLVHCSLSQPPEYTELSYYWEAPVLSEAILLPQTLQITATLHYALSRMRDPENSGPWAWARQAFGNWPAQPAWPMGLGGPMAKCGNCEREKTGSPILVIYA